YQGFARGLSLKEIRSLNKLATGGLTPDITILLDLAPSKSYEKAKARLLKRRRGDRLESEGLSFQKRVREGYRKIARENPGRIKIVPVLHSIEDTQKLIQSVVAKKR